MFIGGNPALLSYDRASNPQTAGPVRNVNIQELGAAGEPG
jgi:hypothetical protein